MGVARPTAAHLIVRGQDMPRDWKQIDIDEILNFDEGHTGRMAQYERIMRQKEIEALYNVHAGLVDFKKAIHQTSDRLEKRLEVLEGLQDNTAKTQGKLQRITIALTVVIALATVTYTWVTWETVQAQREANEIQKQALSKNGGRTNQ